MILRFFVIIKSKHNSRAITNHQINRKSYNVKFRPVNYLNDNSQKNIASLTWLDTLV